MTATCLGCGETDPPDLHGDGHVVVVPGHAPDCGGYCGGSCPIPVQELCGPVEERP